MSAGRSRLVTNVLLSWKVTAWRHICQCRLAILKSLNFPLQTQSSEGQVTIAMGPSGVCPPKVNSTFAYMARLLSAMHVFTEINGSNTLARTRTWLTIHDWQQNNSTAQSAMLWPNLHFDFFLFMCSLSTVPCRHWTFFLGSGLRRWSLTVGWSCNKQCK